MTDDRPYRGDEYEYDSFRTCGGTWRVDGTPPPMIGSASAPRNRLPADPRRCGFCYRTEDQPRCARCADARNEQ